MRINITQTEKEEPRPPSRWSSLSRPSHFSKFYNHSKHLAVDEVIVKFKGRVLFKEYIRKKRKSFGIKILRHSEQCLFPSPQNAFCFTNLSYLVLEVFRFYEYYAQNLNTPQKNSASWDLQLGLNLAFKGLR